MHRRRIPRCRQEQLEMRAEIVVGRDVVVEPQHRRSVPEQCRRMRHVAYQRTDNLLVEPAAQVRTGHTR
jgi:hypothetical protein